MGSKLGNCFTLCGGQDHAHSFIPIFQVLCNVEETSVRTAATESINRILSQLKPLGQNSVVAQAYLDMCTNMCIVDESEVFYGRVSLCQILPQIYRILNEQDRTTLLEIYSKLVTDESPLVRRAAGYVFLQTAEYADIAAANGDFLKIYLLMSADEYPTVKDIAVGNIAGFAVILKKLEAETVLNEQILSLIKSFYEDPSWRVRQALVKDYSKLSTVYTVPDIANEVFGGLIKLLQDSEPEVREKAINSLLPFVKAVGPEVFISQFMPVALVLVGDSMGIVRKSVANACVDIAAKVGPEIVAQHMSDLILKLISDEDPLVRLRILKKLHIIAQEVPSLCTRLTESLKKMYHDANWRVRKQLAIETPAIVNHMGHDFFKDNFIGPFLELLVDGVDEVRIACSESISKISGLINLNWVYDNLFPAVRLMATDEFLVRLSMLTAVSGIILSANLPEKFQTEALALIIGASKDKVANIRIRTAQVLGLICQKVKVPTVRATLADLLVDKDRDVAYFATESMKNCPP
jgi:serine/threonine-protein phosphatase 2A regulatory subunit A